MSDMLVKLYELPPLESALARQQAQGVMVRRGMAAERHLVTTWVNTHFNDHWASETAVAFTHQPVTCYLAVRQQEILGFACYDVAAPNFFGPTGVQPTGQHQGIGTTLLLACLHNMRAAGYAYAIIGGVGPVDFYRKSVGAVLIPDSSPGSYAGMLGLDLGGTNE